MIDMAGDNPSAIRDIIAIDASNRVSKSNAVGFVTRGNRRAAIWPELDDPVLLPAGGTSTKETDAYDITLSRFIAGSRSASSRNGMLKYPVVWYPSGTTWKRWDLFGSNATEEGVALGVNESGNCVGWVRFGGRRRGRVLEEEDRQQMGEGYAAADSGPSGERERVARYQHARRDRRHCSE